MMTDESFTNYICYQTIKHLWYYDLVIKCPYLVTGGYGFIGSAITNALIGDVGVLVRSSAKKNRIKRKITRVIKKDVIDITKKDLAGVSTIFHCASTVNNYHILDDPHIDTKTNVTSTINLLEACKDLKKKPKIIFLSTFFVYGNEYSRIKKPLNENSKTEPLALYPATKLCAESIIKLYSRLYDIPYLICRLTNVYHESEDFNNKKKGAFNYMIMNAVKGKPLKVYRGGNFKRDYIYLDDVVGAIKFLVEKKAWNDTYLVGTGKAVYFKDMIDYLHRITGAKSRIIEIEPPEFHKIVGITDFVADTSRINKLGWKAKVDYKEGIKKIVSNYRTKIIS